MYKKKKEAWRKHRRAKVRRLAKKKAGLALAKTKKSAAPATKKGK